MDEGFWKVVESWNYWREKPKAGVPRDVVSEAWKFTSGWEAVYFYGPRQAGKTTVCLQILEKLSRKEGRKSCLYLNLEEPAFGGKLDASLLDDAVEGFESAFGEKPKFVFLDEAQNLRSWEKWVRVAVDKRLFKVFVTGSNSRLLSSEFSTSLGGRGVGFQVLPFSFKEFKLVHANASVEDYLQTGGYPAVVLDKDAERRRRLLQEYFETAVARDIVARYGVRDAQALRTLAAYVLTNAGKPFSFNKLRAATGLSFEAIKQYLGFLQDAFVIFEVPVLSYSLKKSLEKPRKYYAFDLGLQSAVSKSLSPDWGRRAENAVAIELKRRMREVYYYSNGLEVDFVAKDGLELTAINVCYSDEPPEREEKSLQQFAASHKNARQTLLDKTGLKKWLLQDS